MIQQDKKRTLEMIQRMQFARIGEYSKWKSMIKKLENDGDLNAEELGYVSSLARIYKDAGVTHTSGILHTRLSEEDKKPPCISCGEESLFYCNMNDAYYCMTHVIGHDENERA